MGVNDAEALQSLPLLQDRIKKDAEAYKDEFKLQFEHFQSSLELFTASPQKPDKTFHELVLFIAHTVPYYRDFVEQFIELLVAALDGCSEIVHPLTRRTLVNALLLLRSCQVIQLFRILPLCFDLLNIPDKSLRRSLLGFLVKDITRRNLLKSAQKHDIQRFLLSRLSGKVEGQQKRAARVAIDLYRRGAWRDATLVNALAEGCFSPHLKVAFASAHFLLGYFTPLLDDNDSSDEDDAAGSHAPVGSKKTRSKTRKVEREKDIKRRKEERRHQREAILSSFSGGSILDDIRDPQHLAERLLQRITSSSRRQKDSFALRLALLNVTSRLIGRFQLLVLNFYPLIQRFLNPKQKQITTILAILAQGCHELVPPDDLRPVLKCMMDQFVVEYQAPEVIAVGLNAIREVCLRAPLALDAEMLADLTQFCKFRHKTVVAGARSLVNLYRDLYPELLHRRLRGRAAAIEVADQRAPRPVYGHVSVNTGIEGVELLRVKPKTNALSAPVEDSSGTDDSDAWSDTTSDSGSHTDAADHDVYTDDEDDCNHPEDHSTHSETTDTDEEDAETEDDDIETDEDDDIQDADDVTAIDDNDSELSNDATLTTRSLPMSPKKRGRGSSLQKRDSSVLLDPTQELLTNEDFSRLKRLRQGRSKERCDESDASETSSSTDESSPEDALGVVHPDDLAVTIKKKGRVHRLATMNREKEERMSFAERVKEKGRRVKGSLPESVKRRNKPLLMVKHNRQIRQKQQADVSSRIAHLRKHVKTLKKRTGGKKKYRRQ